MYTTLETVSNSFIQLNKHKRFNIYKMSQDLYKIYSQLYKTSKLNTIFKLYTTLQICIYKTKHLYTLYTTSQNCANIYRTLQGSTHFTILYNILQNITKLYNQFVLQKPLFKILQYSTQLLHNSTKLYKTLHTSTQLYNTQKTIKIFTRLHTILHKLTQL